jgi:hypothetical protein
MDLFLPASRATGFIAAALDDLQPARLGGGFVMTYPLTKSASATPLLGLPEEAHGFLFDILPNIPTNDASGLRKFESYCHKQFEQARALGARVYPIGYPVGTDVMRDSDWRRQFGDEWGRLVEAKRRFDPEDVLTPVPQVFSARQAPEARVTTDSPEIPRAQ